MALGDRAQPGEMNDGIRPRILDCGANAFAIGQIDGDLTVGTRRDWWPLTGDDRVAAIPQVLAEMSPDEPVRAGDEDAHASARSP